MIISTHTHAHSEGSGHLSIEHHVLTCCSQLSNPNASHIATQRALGGILLVLNQVHGTKGTLAGEKSTVSSRENEPKLSPFPVSRLWHPEKRGAA